MIAKLARRQMGCGLQMGYLFSQFDKKPDLYKLLEIKPTATPEEIRFNYYRLVKKYRPDPNADPEKHAKLINEAYIILSNEKLKEKYDK